MERMEDYYGKEVMVFIDEYDTPFVEAHTGWFYDEVDCFIILLKHQPA